MRSRSSHKTADVKSQYNHSKNGLQSNNAVLQKFLRFPGIFTPVARLKPDRPLYRNSLKMLDWQDDLKLLDSELYLDSRQRRALCFVSHAHGDHLGPHEHAICTPPTAPPAARRAAP